MNSLARGLGSCIDEFRLGLWPGRGGLMGPVGEMRGEGEAGMELRLLRIDSTRLGEAVYGIDDEWGVTPDRPPSEVWRIGEVTPLSSASPRSRIGSCGSSSSSISASASSSQPV